MKIKLQKDLEIYLARLTELPFVERARLKKIEPAAKDLRADGVVELRIAEKWHQLLVEHKATIRLNYPLVEALLGRLKRQPKTDWILFTPQVTAPMAAYLRKRGVNYIDVAGNCQLAINKNHFAVIEGRRPPRPVEEARIVGPSGYRVLFALLARPELLQATVREIAAMAGVGKTIAAVALHRLEQEGILAKARAITHLVRPTELLDKWLAGYADILRPRMLIGNFQGAVRDPQVLERHIEDALGDGQQTETEQENELPTIQERRTRWAWGGATAAHRLTGHYRGERTVLHVEDAPPGLPRRLQLLPAREGPVLFLRTPGPLAFLGAATHTAHPLLVYTELLAEGNDRARDAAQEIRERFLGHLK